MATPQDVPMHSTPLVRVGALPRAVLGALRAFLVAAGGRTATALEGLRTTWQVTPASSTTTATTAAPSP